MNKEFPTPLTGVICGHEPCQTRDAKWLCLENIYEKCYRPNMYDIGGTYMEDLPDYWFYAKIENVGKLFLLHISVTCRNEGTLNISLGSSSEILFKKKQHIAFFTMSLTNHKLEYKAEMSLKYLTTYNISEIDVKLLKDMKLYIPISLESKSSCDDATKAHMEYDFRAFLDDPFGSDFVIESADGEKFKVHKSLLSASSEVFKAMLKENTAESQNSYMKMVDVNKEDLYCVIEYIYTGTIQELEGRNFINLLMLSDRYNLHGLRELSECALASQITIDNAIETVVLADLYNSEYLKLEALKFMKCNTSVIRSSMFGEINNIVLCKEILQFIVQS